MRYGIVSDIHGNLPAFEAVLADLGPVDALWCLGDLVGYGPEPNECVELLRSHPNRCLMGNHDMAALGLLDISEFNPAAAAAAEWTARTLNEGSRLYLANLPERLVVEPFTLAHGSPRQPIWEYITHEDAAAHNFGHFETSACLVGHTHVPALFLREASSKTVYARHPGPGYSLEVGSSRFIANPGGVGQPRDGDKRAAYALYDDKTRRLEWRRVPYPFEITQRRMREQGLPIQLIERLALGW